MNPTCIIAGPSTHNQHIERYGRYIQKLFRCVGQIFFFAVFLEDEELLYPLNDTDLFCVHFAIAPVINCCLGDFVASWNQHSPSTEQSMTPEQLYILGMLQQSSAGAVNNGDFSSINLNTYNLDENTSIVDVPVTPDSVLSNTLGVILSQTSNSDFGKDSYMQQMPWEVIFMQDVII